MMNLGQRLKLLNELKVVICQSQSFIRFKWLVCILRYIVFFLKKGHMWDGLEIHHQRLDLKGKV